MIAMLVLGFIACIILYRYLCRYKMNRIQQKLKYAKEAYSINKAIVITLKQANFLGIFFAMFSFWMAIAIPFWGGTGVILGILSLLFCGFGCTYICFHAAKTMILLSDKSYIIIFHSYKKTETCISYGEILYYTYGRDFFRIKTKERYYYFDYSSINFVCLIQKLKQHRIPEKKTFLSKVYRKHWE